MAGLEAYLKFASDPWARWCRSSKVVGFIDMSLKGSGQVFFQENALTGLLFLLAIIYGSQVAGMSAVWIGAIVGLIVSTAVGFFLQMDDATQRMGLCGYNGILVGAALPTFMVVSPMMWVYLVVAAAISTVAFMAIANIFKTWGVPALTFPFNLVNWVFLLAAFQFLRLDLAATAGGHLPTDVTMFAAHIDVTWSYFWTAVFKSVAQVFLIGDAFAGVLILIGLAVASWWAAALALAGAMVAVAVSLVLGAPAGPIGNGIWGYDGVLTAIALGCVFYHPSVRVLLYTLLGVVATVVCHSMVISGLAPLNLPAGTGPFVFATWLFLLPKRDLVPVHHKKLSGGAIELAPATDTKSA